MARQRGFTLLEVIIAVAIFSLLAMGTYRMLSTVLRTDETTRRHERDLRELSRAFASLDRDLNQVINRSIRDGYGDERAAMLGELGASDGKAALEFTRNGWRNPLGATRAQSQRVRWRLSGEHLERLYWTVLDQAVDSQPRVQKVLDGVLSMQLRFLNDEGEWQGQWPSALDDRNRSEALESLPLAVEVMVEHRHYGELTRLYRLPEALILEQLGEPGAHAGAEQSEGASQAAGGALPEAKGEAQP